MSDEHPILQMISRVINVMIIVALPFMFLFMLWSLPQWIKARSRSRNHIERTYWNIRVFGLTALVYGITILTVLFCLCTFTNYNVYPHWPTISGLFGLGGNDQDFKVAWDICISLFTFGVTCIVAPIYGSHDLANMEYTAPDWFCARMHIEDVDARWLAAQQNRPSDNPQYRYLSPVEKQILDKDWQERLDDATRRRAHVHAMYRRQ